MGSLDTLEPDPTATRAAEIPTSPEDGSRPLTVIEPRRGLGRLGLVEVWEYRHLLWHLVLRQMRGRYRPTVVGWGWIVLQPLLFCLVYYAVFGLMLKVDTGPIPYPVFVFSGILLWLFFSGGVTSAANSLVSNYGVMTKVYYPRLLLPLTSVMVNSLELLAGLAILGGLMAVYGLGIDARILWAPVFLAGIVLSTFAAGIIVAALSVKVRDVLMGMPSAMRILMYAMPFVYPVSLIPGRYHVWYFLNPVSSCLQGFRWAVLGDAFPPPEALAGSTAMLLVSLIVGLYYFSRTERTMVDLL